MVAEFLFGFWLYGLKQNLNRISEAGSSLALFYLSTEYQLWSINSSKTGLPLYCGGSFWFWTVLVMIGISATRGVLANFILYYLFWRSQGWLTTVFNISLRENVVSYWLDISLLVTNLTIILEAVESFTLSYLPQAKWLWSNFWEVRIREREVGVSFLILVNMVSMNHNQIVEVIANYTWRYPSARREFLTTSLGVSLKEYFIFAVDSNDK